MGALAAGTVAYLSLSGKREDPLPATALASIHKAAALRERRDLAGAGRAYELAYADAASSKNSKSSRLLYQLALALGDLQVDGDDVPAASLSFNRALRHARETHGAAPDAASSTMVGVALSRLGDAAASNGDAKRAEACYLESLSMLVPTSNILIEQATRRSVAQASSARADMQLKLAQQHGPLLTPASSSSPLDVGAKAVAADAILAQASEALAARQDLDVVAALADVGEDAAAVLFNLGGLYLSSGQFSQASQVLRICEQVCDRCAAAATASGKAAAMSTPRSVRAAAVADKKAWRERAAQARDFRREADMKARKTKKNGRGEMKQQRQQ